MEKKLRRDFKERQKIKEEAKLLGKEYMDADEAGKLKHEGKLFTRKTDFRIRSTKRKAKEIPRMSFCKEVPKER